MDANNVCRKGKDTVFLLDLDLIFQNKALLQIQINNFSSLQRRKLSKFQKLMLTILYKLSSLFSVCIRNTTLLSFQSVNIGSDPDPLLKRIPIQQPQQHPKTKLYDTPKIKAVPNYHFSLQLRNRTEATFCAATSFRVSEWFQKMSSPFSYPAASTTKNSCVNFWSKQLLLWIWMCFFLPSLSSEINI